MVQDWYYSPAAGEVCLDVTSMSDDEIRLAHKAIEAEFALSGGVEILISEDPDGGAMEWWIYKAVRHAHV